MSDDTTMAIKALIEQVATLTETVHKQDEIIRGVKDHNDRLLDQKKDSKRNLLDTIAQETRDRALANAGMVRNADGSMRLASGAGDTGDAVVISRETARNPAAYRDAKAAAATRGVPLRIAADGQDPTTRNTDSLGVMESKVFTFDDAHERVRYVRADMQTGSGIVQRRLAAEREGFTVKTFNTVDDLPAHARQKFEMMEASANAQSDS